MCKYLWPPGTTLRRCRWRVWTLRGQREDSAVWGEDSDDRGHLQWGGRGTSGHWTLDTILHNTRHRCWQMCTVKGIHLTTLHLRNSLLSREHQVMMDIKEGMELISCCCQDPEAEGPEREGRWSLVTAPSFTISPAVFHRSIVWEQLTTSNEDSATKELH